LIAKFGDGLSDPSWPRGENLDREATIEIQFVIEIDVTYALLFNVKQIAAHWLHFDRRQLTGGQLHCRRGLRRIGTGFARRICFCRLATTTEH